MSNRIKLGNYKDKDLYWIPIYTNDPRYYILEDPICKMPFDMGLAGYKDSLIRKFIIEDFIPNSFTQEDLNKLQPINEKFGDYASLITRVEMKNHGGMSKEMFKYKGGWWLYAPVNDVFNVTSSSIVTRLKALLLFRHKVNNLFRHKVDLFLQVNL